MSLLNKFSHVEIKADARISEADKAVCLREQEAFDKSGPALQKIAEAIAAAKVEQFAILGGEDDRYPHLSSWGSYISHDGFHCDEECVDDMMIKRNTRFIHQIVNYFKNKYTVELNESVIAEHLIPAGPQEPQLPWGGYREMTNEEIDAFKEKHATYKVEQEKHNASWERHIVTDGMCQRRFKNVRKWRRNFVILWRRAGNKIKRFLAGKEY